jgi:hypothetical protein
MWLKVARSLCKRSNSKEAGEEQQQKMMEERTVDKNSIGIGMDITEEGKNSDCSIRITEREREPHLAGELPR